MPSDGARAKAEEIDHVQRERHDDDDDDDDDDEITKMRHIRRGNKMNHPPRVSSSIVHCCMPL
jgi:hypothetical protein